jgi:phosphate butyryltransferase
LISNFDELLKVAIERGPKKVAVACAEDEEILKALKYAYEKKIVEPILVGNLEKIKAITEAIGFNISNLETHDLKTMEAAAEKSVKLVSSGHADMVMKGLIDTSKILKAVLNKEYGLRTGNVLSHVS